jgi:protocatechuate 3,4-dioxygenase beta subunit
MSDSAEGVVEWARTWRGKTRRLIEISNAKWDKEEARRGDVLLLSADVKGARDGTEAQIEIWEHDADGNHDFIEKFLVQVKNEKVETEWKFEYNEDTDEISTAEESEKGYNPPEYFFRVTAKGETTESGLLRFRDWIEIRLLDGHGEPVAGAEYVILFADGSKTQGKLDKHGSATINDVPPGPYWLQFPEHEDSI